MHDLVLYLHRQKQSPQVFCKKGVHRNFAKFTKYSCARDSFLVKLHLRDATLLKKSPCHWCFSVNFEKFLRTPFFKTPLDDCFYKELNGCKIAFTGRSSNRTCSVRKSVLRNSGQQLYQKSDSGAGVFLWILRNCSEHLFYWTPLGDDFCNGEFQHSKNCPNEYLKFVPDFPICCVFIAKHCRNFVIKPQKMCNFMFTNDN